MKLRRTGTYLERMILQLLRVLFGPSTNLGAGNLMQPGSTYLLFYFQRAMKAMGVYKEWRGDTISVAYLPFDCQAALDIHLVEKFP